MSMGASELGRFKDLERLVESLAKRIAELEARAPQRPLITTPKKDYNRTSN